MVAGFRGDYKKTTLLGGTVIFGRRAKMGGGGCAGFDPNGRGSFLYAEFPDRGKTITGPGMIMGEK